MRSYKHKQGCVLFLLTGLLLFHNSYGQISRISIGPTTTLGSNSLQNSGRKGFGGSIEMYYKLFFNSGLRLYTGYDRFHTPKIERDQVSYIPIRLGYQQYFGKNKFIIFGDVGMGLFIYPSHSTYGGFSFSTGGGYNIHLKRQKFIQFQSYYCYNHNSDPFNTGSYFGWFTFRIAFGFEFGKKK